MNTWRVTREEDLVEVVTAVLQAIAGEAARATTLALHGDLGAGKTTFVQTLARQIGVTETVTSPTFVIMKQYTPTERYQHLRHIDAYRIEAVEEMEVLGFNAWLLEPGTLICIEWAERIASLLPPDTFHLTFSLVGDTREITLHHGSEH